MAVDASLVVSLLLMFTAYLVYIVIIVYCCSLPIWLLLSTSCIAINASLVVSLPFFTSSLYRYYLLFTSCLVCIATIVYCLLMFTSCLVCIATIVYCLLLFTTCLVCIATIDHFHYFLCSLRVLSVSLLLSIVVHFLYRYYCSLALPVSLLTRHWSFHFLSSRRLCIATICCSLRVLSVSLLLSIVY